MATCYLETEEKILNEGETLYRCGKCKRAVGVILHMKHDFPTCDENGNPIEYPLGALRAENKIS